MKFIKIVVLILISIVITFGISNLKSVKSLEEQTFDARHIFLGPNTIPSSDIVMVWLDQRTMKTLNYRSPVPRDFLAKVINNIESANPKLIAIDIFFEDPSFPKADEKLANALKNATIPIYAVVPNKPANQCENEISKSVEGCMGTPLDIFHTSLTGVGLANLPYNASDSTVRRAKLSFETDQGETPSFSALLAKTVLQNDINERILNQKGFGPFYLSPKLDDNSFFIRFAGAPSKPGEKGNAFKVYSALLIEKGIIPKRLLENKIVLIGADYSDMQDAFLTPYFTNHYDYARMNGVEVHTNTLSQLLTNQFYFVFSPALNWLLTLIFVTAVVLITYKYSTLIASIFTTFIIILLWIFSAFIFNKTAVIIPLIVPSIGILISFAGSIVWKALVEGKQKRWIKGVFAKYVPPAVVEQMTANPALLKLGGEERIVTSFFTDIASFTSISEKMNPTTLVAFLNEYLSMMNEIIFRYNGTIDKYEGDAVIAFFNAPLNVPNHEENAVKAALEVQDISKTISKKWKEKCGRDIVTRVGVNTGKAVVGNIGSEGRFDYTAIGDTINLASRLEGTNKFYDTTVMLSEFTEMNLPDSFICRPIDKVRVKGKSESVTLFEPWGTNVESDKKSFLKNYLLAWNNFYEGKTDEALKIIKELKNKFPTDGPLIDLEKRCNKANDDSNWDRITELTSK